MMNLNDMKKNKQKLENQKEFRESRLGEEVGAFANVADMNRATAVMIPYDELARHPKNRKPTEIEDMVKSLLEHKQLEPLLVTKKTVDGKHIILSGERRFTAMGIIRERYPENHDFDFVKCDFSTAKTELEEFEILGVTNAQRENLTQQEEYDYYWSLKEEFEKAINRGETPEGTFKERYKNVLKQGNKGSRHAARMISIYEGCIKELIPLIDEGKLTMHIAESISVLSKDVQAVIADMVKSGYVVTEDIVAGIKEDPESAKEVIEAYKQSGKDTDESATISELRKELEAKDTVIKMYESNKGEEREPEKASEEKKGKTVKKTEELWNKLGTNSAAVTKKIGGIGKSIDVLFNESNITYNQEQKKQIEDLIEKLRSILSR